MGATQPYGILQMGHEIRVDIPCVCETQSELAFLTDNPKLMLQTKPDIFQCFT